MTTALTTELIEKIKATEKEEARLDNKIWGIHSTVKTTREIVESMAKKRNSFPGSILIRRNLRLDLILSLAACVAIITPVIFILMTDTSGNVIGKALALTLVFLLPFVLYRNLTHKKLILPISLSNKQIEIIGETYRWDEIENTFFVYRPSSKDFRAYFVIGLKDGELKYFDIGNQFGFKYNENDFSEFVEYYKNECYT
jgi:hypothetical protein